MSLTVAQRSFTRMTPNGGDWCEGDTPAVNATGVEPLHPLRKGTSRAKVVASTDRVEKTLIERVS